MSQIEIDRVLSQIRALRQRAVAHDGPSVGGLTPGARATSSVAANNVVSFDAVLRNGLDAVNRADTQARESVTAFERGAPGVDLARVMIDMQKASVSFRGAVEVRNRVVAAYQDVMNMPI
ncbi:MAG: flagellar hook-basal body complex protein FliE [Steroidobacteraceae bacterium]